MKHFLLLALLFPINSIAALDGAPKIVAHQLKQKLSLIQDAFQEMDGHAQVLHSRDNEAYYLKRIRLQYAPFVAFDVSIFELKVKPILEFRWTRKNPSGWMNYKRKI